MSPLNKVLEKISISKKSSLSLLVNPNLSDLFYWHFHPELELVLIDGADGTRHVGDHISRFKGSDLVFIGSNIPHLNFDYGVKSSYEKIVIHFKPDFLRDSIYSTPELKEIHHLFELSKFGLSFGKATIKAVGERLKKLNELNHFDQFLEFLSILHVLANAEDLHLLHERPVENQHTSKDHDRLSSIYSLIEENYRRKISIEEIADHANLTKEAFCRYFKKMTRLTFTEFVNQYRIDKSKKLLLKDYNINETCFACGFGSVSYFNRIFKKLTGENPSAFKRQFS